jgi:hypothetical protein
LLSEKVKQIRCLVIEFLLGGAWAVYEKLKSSGWELKNFENMPSGIVPKSPKPGFVSFGAIDVGVIWSFWYA